MQRIRPALEILQKEIGLDHALASRKLYTDGAEVLFDYGESQAETSEGRAALRLVVARSGQRVFVETIIEYLKKIEYSEDGYASLIHLPEYREADIVADPKRSFGAPIFERGGARLQDVLERFWAGDTMATLSAEFGVPLGELEDMARVASRQSS